MTEQSEERFVVNQTFMTEQSEGTEGERVINERVNLRVGGSQDLA